MIQISGTQITMTRGDTLIAQVDIYQGDTEYTPQPGDSIRFAVKSPRLNSNGTEFVDVYPLLIKNIPIDTMLLRLDPNDTKPLGFGAYVYDIELTYADGAVDTFIADAELVITPEVH